MSISVYSLCSSWEEKLPIFSPQRSAEAGIIIAPPLVVIITGSDTAFCVKN